MNKIFKIVIWIFFSTVIIGMILSAIEYKKELKGESEAMVTSPDFGSWFYVKKGTFQKENNCIKFTETKTDKIMSFCGSYSIKELKN